MALTPKAFAVLSHLVTHAGELVTKDALLDTVWPETAVSEAVLKVCVNEIRKVLNDSARAPRFIDTVYRRGYRFVAPVTTVSPDPGHAGDTGRQPESASAADKSRRLVGRETELAQLHACLGQAREGKRQVVFITGEAGIGKTALVETFLAQIADDATLHIGQGQCVEHYGPSEAYMPILEALGRVCRGAPNVSPVAFLRHQAPTWLAQMPWLLPTSDREELQRELLGATQERMLRELAEVMEALTAEVPLVLVLEDLHWSDFATLDAVSVLARRREPARLLLLGTYRPVEVILHHHPLKTVKQELQTHGACTELPLELLSATAVAVYLRGRFPQRVCAPNLVRLLHQRTDGNPFFLVHLVEHMVTHNLITERAGVWELTVDPVTSELEVPEDIRHMITQQLEKCQPDVQQLLEVASVAGMEFTAAAVAAALEQDPVQIEQQCEELVRQQYWLRLAGVVTWPDGTVTGRYAFQHWLYQCTAYWRLGRVQRLQLHRRIGARSETAYGLQAYQIAAELAMHFERGQDFQRAVMYWQQLAGNAARRYANREAIDALTRALELLVHLPATERAALSLALLEQRGLIRRSMGDLQQAATDFIALATGARQQGNREVETNAWFYLASVLSWIDRARCLEAVEQAMRLGERLEDPLQQAHSRGWAGYWHLLWRGWRQDDARASAAAVEAARRAGDRALLSLHLGQYSYFQCLQSDYQGACLTAAEGSQLALEIGNASDYLLCQFFSAWALLHHGKWGEMWHLLQAGIQLAERNGHRRWALLFRLELAWLCEQAYDFSQAEALCEHVLQQTAEVQLPYGQVLGLVLLGLANLGLEEHERAHRCFGDVTQRLEQERLLMDWILRLPFHYGLSRFWLMQDALTPARQHAAWLCELAVQPGERTYLALGRHMLARIAMGAQQWEQAEAELSQAFTALTAVQPPVAVWQVYATAAHIHAQRGLDAKAHYWWSRSAEVLQRLANSLDDVGTLRQSFLTSPEVQTVFRHAQNEGADQ